MYLIVHSTPIPYSKDCPKKVMVKIEMDQIPMACQADRLEGGQRFLLPEKMTQMMIKAFCDKKKVTVSLPGYQSLIDGEKFMDHFQKMGRSFMDNPFRLPY